MKLFRLRFASCTSWSGWVGLGWVEEVMSWVGLGWVTEFGPMAMSVGNVT
jgi:hypothetical protein